MDDLPEAVLSKNGTIVQPQVHESELKRCQGFWGGNKNVPCKITLTNQRLLVQPITTADDATEPSHSQDQEDGVVGPATPTNGVKNSSARDGPRELALSSLVKAKVPTPGFLGKKSSHPTLQLKTTDEKKYQISFSQQELSLYTPDQERDDVLRLIQEYLKVHQFNYGDSSKKNKAAAAKNGKTKKKSVSKKK